MWVADINYVGNGQNPMYLSLISDAYSKKNMGYNLVNSLETEQPEKALKQAIKNRKYPLKQLIHHPDRGLQYCNNSCQKLLLKNKIRCQHDRTIRSVSKGYCRRKHHSL